jgi:MFS-type transporter involved in bile tolerance (Atg22 family)
MTTTQPVIGKASSRRRSWLHYKWSPHTLHDNNMASRAGRVSSSVDGFRRLDSMETLITTLVNFMAAFTAIKILIDLLRKTNKNNN